MFCSCAYDNKTLLTRNIVKIKSEWHTVRTTADRCSQWNRFLWAYLLVEDMDLIPLSYSISYSDSITGWIVSTNQDLSWSDCMQWNNIWIQKKEKWIFNQKIFVLFPCRNIMFVSFQIHSPVIPCTMEHRTTWSLFSEHVQSTNPQVIINSRYMCV